MDLQSFRLTLEIEHNRIIVSLSWHSGYNFQSVMIKYRLWTADCGQREPTYNNVHSFVDSLFKKRYSCIRKLKTSTLNSVYVLPFCRKISCRFVKIYLRLCRVVVSKEKFSQIFSGTIAETEGRQKEVKILP